MVPRGKVYAVEVVKDFLQTITNKVKDAALTNVECFWGDVEKVGGTKIAPSIVNAVIASNILFQVEDKDKFITEAKRILCKGGRVLLIDWESDTESLVKGGAIPKNLAKDMFEKKGFKLDKEIDAGAHHYGMIFIKNEE
jgi:ubiquinone/menaquinone biosynthesis C-methylase UbiE